MNHDLLEDLLINHDASAVAVETYAESDMSDEEYNSIVEMYLTDAQALQAFIADNPGASLDGWDSEGRWIG